MGTPHGRMCSFRRAKCDYGPLLFSYAGFAAIHGVQDFPEQPHCQFHHRSSDPLIHILLRAGEGHADAVDQECSGGVFCVRQQLWSGLDGGGACLLVSGKPEQQLVQIGLAEQFFRFPVCQQFFVHTLGLSHADTKDEAGVVCDAGGVAVIGVELAGRGAVDAGDGRFAGCQPIILRQFVKPAKKLIFIREPLACQIRSPCFLFGGAGAKPRGVDLELCPRPACDDQISGPDTVDGMAPAGQWDSWWQRAVQERREAASWSAKESQGAEGETA